MRQGKAVLNPRYFVLGEILRPHGIRGEARMRLTTDYPEQLKDLRSVYLGDSADDEKPLAIGLESVRFHQNYALLTLHGYRDRDAAERLRQKYVLLPMDEAQPLEEGEYYLFQLVGLTVYDGDRRVGVVKEILETGANDVYIVSCDDGSEALLPAHDETIESIDFDAGLIRMRLPDGVLPLA